jgi:hypothetical protein
MQVHDDTASDGVSSDIISYVAWQKHMTEAKSFDEDATRCQLSFWQQLSEAAPDISLLQDLAAKINTNIAGCHTAFTALLKLQPNSTEVMRMYASFLADLTNDAQQSAAMLKKADDFEEKQSHLRHQQLEKQPQADDRQAVVTVSGSKHKYVGGSDRSCTMCVRMFVRAFA